MKRSIIKIRDLTFKYQENIIFDNLNLDIYEGTFTTIVGLNGSGKTTLAKLLSGFIRGEGYINIDGYLLNNFFIDKIRRNFSICMDNDIYFDTIRDCLAFPLESLQYTKNEINITLDKVSKKIHIDNILDKSLEDITQSEKNKVLVAASLIHNPRIILLDNTLSKLTPMDKKQVLKVLKEYQKDYNLTIILLTTDLEETLDSDKIIVLNKGSILAEDSPKEIYKDDLLEKIGFNLPFIVKLSHNLILYDLLEQVYLKDKEALDKLWP